MRYGFTTGSCGAAAAKAAAYMLLMGREKREIAIETPKGIVYRARVLDICRGEREVSCGVEKDGGDDPDVTTGAMVYARVSFGDGGIVIEGGGDLSGGGARGGHGNQAGAGPAGGQSCH